MRRSALAVATGLVALMVLGCGGAWSEAMSRTMQDQVEEMRGRVAAVEEGPARQTVLEQLDALKVAIADGRVGLMEFAGFQADLQKVLEDGVIEAAEATAIAAQVQEIAAE